MRNLKRVSAGTCLLALGFVAYSRAAMQNKPETPRGEVRHALGTFEVKGTPLEPGDKPDTIGRFVLEKQFHGDLEATSKAQFLTASTAVKGSAAYVAIEQVSGSLHGRSGSFVLQHSGTMTRGGSPQLSVTVVPDSGTDHLVGLAGKMTIIVADGKHSYDLEYTLTDHR